MERVEISPLFAALIASASNLAQDSDAKGILLLADAPFDFKAISQKLSPTPLIVASHVGEVHTPAV